MTLPDDDLIQSSRMEPQPLAEPVSVLMPICNEIDIVRSVVEEWRRDVFAHLPVGSELVFEDCSDDGTGKVLEELARQYPFIRVTFAPKDGFQNTAMRLYRQARCPLVFFTDSDGQYVAEEFWKVAARIGGNDMVHGSKKDRQDPLYRVWASRVFNWLTACVFRTRGTDINSAFRLIRLSMIVGILPRIRHLPNLPNAEMYLLAEREGYRIEDVPVRHRPRPHGRSRALPLFGFARACWKVLGGMMALRREMKAVSPAREKGTAVAS